MPLIESKQNPKIKTLVKLRERKQRDASGLFLVEGYRELERAIKSRFEIEELYFCPAFYRSGEFDALVEKVTTAGMNTQEVTQAVFEKISYRDGPDGILAVVQQQNLELSSFDLPANPLLVVVEAIEKPGNLGAIMRSADSAGADALICCDPVIDSFNPNIIRASQGAFFQLPFYQASSEAAIDFLNQNGVHIISTTPGAECLYWDAPLKGPAAIVMGSEKEGLSDTWLGADNGTQVTIPQKGISDSLNVSVATSLVLYEALRQRRSQA